jgi:hypothetical protein
MNNEPVAYGMLTFCKNCGEQNPYAAKTLTDEEIVEVFDNTFKVRDFEDYFLKFARAILRKAQEA